MKLGLVVDKCSQGTGSSGDYSNPKVHRYVFLLSMDFHIFSSRWVAQYLIQFTK